MNIAKELMDLQAKLSGDRSTVETTWQEIADFTDPGNNAFFDARRQQGEQRTDRIITSQPIAALGKGISAMNSTVTPSSTPWSKLSTFNQEILKDKESMEWYDTVSDLLFKKRYSTNSYFANENYMCLESIMKFGTGVMITEDLKNGNIGYRCGFIGEFYFMENKHGIVDYVIRKYRRTARQAAQMFGNNLPEIILKAVERDPTQEFDFLHCVKPNEDKISNRDDFKGMKYSSYHIACENNYFIEEGGFRTFPFHIGRWTVAPNEVYGRGLGWTLLPEVKMVNAIASTDLSARHLALTPPLLVANERGLREPNLTPGAVNWGALDMNGRPLIVPFNAQNNINVADDTLNRLYELINDISLVSLFQILVDAPQMTATEVLQRAQEKGILLAPPTSRLQTEFYSTMIEREIDILDFNGALPPASDLMQQIGIQYEVEYNAPINLMQKAGKALATERFIQSIIPIAQYDPKILNRIDWNEYVKIMQEVQGVDASLVRSDEEYEAIVGKQEQDQQLAQIAAAAPDVTSSIKNIAEAQNIGA